MSAPDPFKTFQERREAADAAVEAMLVLASRGDPGVAVALAESKVVALCKQALAQALEERDHALLRADEAERVRDEREESAHEWYEMTRRHHNRATALRDLLFAAHFYLTHGDTSTAGYLIKGWIDGDTTGALGRWYERWVRANHPQHANPEVAV